MTFLKSFSDVIALTLLSESEFQNFTALYLID